MSGLTDEQWEAFANIGTNLERRPRLESLINEAIANALREQREGIAAAIGELQTFAVDDAAQYRIGFGVAQTQAVRIARNYGTKEADQ